MQSVPDHISLQEAFTSRHPLRPTCQPKKLCQSQTLLFFRGTLMATFSDGDWLSLKSAAQELSSALRSSAVFSEVEVWMDWDTLCTSLGRC